jgi:hypothetical protein
LNSESKERDVGVKGIEETEGVTVGTETSEVRSQKGPRVHRWKN